MSNQDKIFSIVDINKPEYESIKLPMHIASRQKIRFHNGDSGLFNNWVIDQTGELYIRVHMPGFNNFTMVPYAKKGNVFTVEPIEPHMLEKYIFTFGCGQPLAGKCQPVYATSYAQARSLMVARYDDEWAFQYSEEQWEAIRNDPDRCWPMEEELKPIYCD